MLRFEDGKHLKNYLLKILKNTNSDITQFLQRHIH